jgi:Flp pilus assembly protein TadG
VAGRSDTGGAGALLRRFLTDDRGAIAPMVGMSLALMLAVGGLAWDVSRGFALRAELEAAADAAALAGATQLDGTDGARARATTAAQGSLVTNGQKLADNAEANSTTNAAITYLVDLTTRTVAGNDADANFIQVNIAPRNMGLVFGAFTAVANFQVRAHAVAGYGAAICKVPPLMVCNPDEASGETTFDADAHIGAGMILKTKPGNDPWGPGNFGYLSVTGEDGIKEAMGKVTPQIQCFGTTAETQPGNITSAEQYFNTRFGFFYGSANNLKSNVDYMPSQNTITGRGNDCSLAASTYTQCGGATPATMGLPRDCCAYSGGSCTGPENSALGTGVWERSMYLTVNHNGATLPTNWTSYGPNPTCAGCTAPTRYQLYKWENSLIAAGAPFPANTFQQQANDAYGATCYTGGAINPNAPDRRTISAVVVNCIAEDIRGHEDVAIVGYLDIFLTEPVQTIGSGGSSSMAIYGEIIGNTTNASAVGEETKLFSVRLYE